jgi:ATP-dependent protease HslVU (ClpYQ) peptidase subunit
VSIVVAIHTPEGFGMASDSQVSGGPYDPKFNTTKIHEIGGFFVGIVGNHPSIHHMVAALRRHLCEPQAHAAVVDLLRAAHVDVVAETGGSTPGEYPKSGCTVLLVDRNGILEMDACGSVDRHESFWATGAGQPYALATVRTLDNYVGRGRMTLRDRLTEAVTTACHYLPSCGGPVQALTSESAP